MKQFCVLNTLQDNAADVSVDSSGYLNVKGLSSIKAGSLTKVKRISGASETLGVVTFTIGAQNSYSYHIRFSFQDSNYNTVYQDLYYASAASGETPTTICDQFRTLLTALGLPVTGGGTTTLTITGTAGHPVVIGSDPNNDSNIAVAQTTAGIVRKGYGSDLANLYGSTGTNGVAITTTATYTQWELYLADASSYIGAANKESSDACQVILINEAATTAGTDSAATNLNLLQNTSYGSLTLLAAGYMTAASDVATTTAAITVTTGAIALASGSVTLASLGAESGDYLVIAATGDAAFTTTVFTKITGITGAAAGYGTNVVAQSADDFKYISVRNIPI